MLYEDIIYFEDAKRYRPTRYFRIIGGVSDSVSYRCQLRPCRHASTHAHGPKNRTSPFPPKRHCTSQKNEESFSGKTKSMPCSKIVFSYLAMSHFFSFQLVFGALLLTPTFRPACIMVLMAGDRRGQHRLAEYRCGIMKWWVLALGDSVPSQMQTITSEILK